MHFTNWPASIVGQHGHDVAVEPGELVVFGAMPDAAEADVDGLVDHLFEPLLLLAEVVDRYRRNTDWSERGSQIHPVPPTRLGCTLCLLWIVVQPRARLPRNDVQVEHDAEDVRVLENEVCILLELDVDAFRVRRKGAAVEHDLE